MSERTKKLPWDRLKGEKTKDYKHFIDFRNQGPFRSIKGLSEKTGISRGIYHRCAQHYDWWTRAAAWDDHCQQMRNEVYEKSVVSLQQKAMEHLPALLNEAVDIATGHVEGSHQQVSMLNSLLDRFGLAAPKKVMAQVTHRQEDSLPDLSHLTLEEKKQFLELMERIDEREEQAQQLEAEVIDAEFEPTEH